jgi:hypothetical protein
MYTSSCSVSSVSASVAAVLTGAGVDKSKANDANKLRKTRVRPLSAARASRTRKAAARHAPEPARRGGLCRKHAVVRGRLAQRRQHSAHPR